jgi:hypothetical protein
LLNIIILFLDLFIFYPASWYGESKAIQFRGRWLGGQGVLFGVEARERGGIANKDVRKLASKACCCRDRLCLDTFANLQLEPTSTVLPGCFSNVDRNGLVLVLVLVLVLGTLGPPRV